MNERERLERSRDAELLLEHYLLVEAFELLEQKYLQELRNTALTEESERTQLWHRLKALDALKLELRRVAEDGYLLRTHLERAGKSIFGGRLR